MSARLSAQPGGTSAPPRRLRALQVASLALSVASALVALPAMAQLTPPDPAPVPQGLKGAPVPTPSTLGSYIVNKQAAIRLGKALFWDMQVGSDGKTACASCHFQAGADPRDKNQIAPGLNVRSSPHSPAPDSSFQIGGPNYKLKFSDFPTTQFANPNDRHSALLRTTNDVVSSQGVFNEKFISVTQGASSDVRQPVFDSVFHVGASSTRRVEPRNTPTVINAVFNFRNFWDGRAQYLFNGVNPLGGRDTNARVFQTIGGAMTPVQVRIDNASLASQASGPPGSTFEMSADGRSFMDLGKRLLRAKPLALQKVSISDSVLGVHVNLLGNGLNVADYSQMVKAAFQPQWWNGTQAVQIDAAGNRSVVAMPAALAANQYSQMQANFSLIFSLAIQLYEATLVSDDSPFDRHMAGLGSMNAQQVAGMGVFFGKGKCAECHGGPEFTNASVRKTIATPLARMVMGDGGIAVYDEGFYNTAVAKTLTDIHNGDKDPFGKPISNTGFAQVAGNAAFKQVIGIAPNLTVAPGERIAVNGASKTSTIRNVELTAPYFSNGSAATLLQVVEFYNRGGNFAANNRPDLDAEIEPLGLSAEEQFNLVEFMKALTDNRVRYKRAPFDHPQLLVPNGHNGSNTLVTDAGNGQAQDSTIVIPAVGAGGVSDQPKGFLDDRFFGLVAKNSGKCVDVQGGQWADGTPINQFDCKANGDNDNQLWEEVAATGGFLLRNKMTGKCLDVSQISYTAGAKIWDWNCHGGPNQVFNWNASRLVVKHSGMCLNVPGASTANRTQLIQWPCTTTATNDVFTKR